VVVVSLSAFVNGNRPTRCIIVRGGGMTERISDGSDLIESVVSRGGGFVFRIRDTGLQGIIVVGKAWSEM
jgi:hypothetical protein